MIHIRTASEIDAIARAGAVVAACLMDLARSTRAGVITGEIDAMARRLLAERGGVALFEGLVRHGPRAFPGVICVCVNDQATHGVPGARVLMPGDVVTLDLGASVDGWCADASVVVVVGGDDAASVARAEARRRLAAVAQAATRSAIDAMRPGVRWSTCADAALAVAREAGCRLVAGYAGHGVGRALHEAPAAPMFPGPRDDFVLRPGMVLTVEPIVVGPLGGVGGGGVELKVSADGWTVSTVDGADACQVEHTVAVVGDGVRVLTEPAGRGTASEF